MRSILSRLLLAASILSWAQCADAQNAPPYFFDVPGTTITRPSNTTQYSANVTVCQSASAACTPGNARTMCGFPDIYPLDM